jgi:hypothetical protein
MREQAGWDDHAAFMDGLVAEGFILLGGPLGEGTRFLHVVAATSPEEIEARLAADPWRLQSNSASSRSSRGRSSWARASRARALSDDGAEPPRGLRFPAARCCAAFASRISS